MGLFGNNIKIEKEQFNGCFNLQQNEIANFREKQGFKINLENQNGKVVITARQSKFLKQYTITNIYYQNRTIECSVLFVDFDKTEIFNFLKSNFKYNGSYYELPNGDKLHESSLGNQPSYSLYFIIDNDNNPNSKVRLNIR